MSLRTLLAIVALVALLLATAITFYYPGPPQPVRVLVSENQLSKGVPVSEQLVPRELAEWNGRLVDNRILYVWPLQAGVVALMWWLFCVGCVVRHDAPLLSQGVRIVSATVVWVAGVLTLFSVASP